jgi:hypothetical protein|tara:strand:- start:240 stop:605 length:366 start_codon:yes stop_codon:yes gene_type:complete
MRFTEFKLNENSNKELESALVNTLTNLRGEADKRHEASEISFSAVEEIMKNTGHPTFSYALFKNLYDSGETLKNVVKDFDQEKIVLKTEKDAETDPAMDFDNQGSTDKVKQMAKSAMNRRR